MIGSERERIVVKEFGPEPAGERVGWVGIEQSEVDSNYSLVHITTASVGKEGAVHDYLKIQHNGKVINTHTHRSSPGLSDAASITIPINRTKDSIDPSTLSFRSNREDDTTRSILHGSKALFDKSPGMQYDANNWADSTHGLSELLKNRLADTELDSYYPGIYYAMNMAFMHEKSKPVSDEYSSIDYAVADPDMAVITAEEIQKAASIKQHLYSAQLVDASMRSSLQEPIQLSMVDLIECFRASRFHVRAAELAAWAVQKTMETPHGILQPIRSVRTWPYMDPEVEGEQGFSVELNHLKQSRTADVISTIEHEQAALSRRLQFTEMGHTALRLLSQKELTLITL